MPASTLCFQETKNIINNKPADQEIKIAAIGDKARAALARLYASSFVLAGNEIGE